MSLNIRSLSSRFSTSSDWTGLIWSGWPISYPLFWYATLQSISHGSINCCHVFLYLSWIFTVGGLMETSWTLLTLDYSSRQSTGLLTIKGNLHGLETLWLLSQTSLTSTTVTCCFVFSWPASHCDLWRYHRLALTRPSLLPESWPHPMTLASNLCLIYLVILAPPDHAFPFAFGANDFGTSHLQDNTATTTPWPKWSDTRYPGHQQGQHSQELLPDWHQ